MTLTMRTIKIALATVLAIWLASLFQLENSLSAGIIAILSVLDTRWSSLETALERFFSTLLALAIAVILFLIFGYSPLVFGLYLLIYVPLAYKFGLQSGIAPCSVLVTHLLLAESVALSLLGNEILLMVIGAGIAILFNIYMPNQSAEVEKLKLTVEQEMKQILTQLNILLRKEEAVMDIDFLLEKLEESLEKGNRVALNEYDNQIFEKSDYYLHYFQMRKDQISVLKQIYQNLGHIELSTEQSADLGNLFELTAQQLHELNTGKTLLQNVDFLHEQFRKTDLPQTRIEFESRAILYQIMLDFKKFLQIKREFSLKVQQRIIQ